MTNILGVLAGSVFCVVIASAPVKTDSDRDVRDLTKRIEKLEQSAEETSKKLDKLAKSVADLEKALSAGSQGSNSRDPVVRAESNEKRIKGIEKDLEQVSKYVTELQKQVGAKAQDISEYFRRRDARITQLSDWFDEYHPRQNESRYHHDQCERAR